MEFYSLTVNCGWLFDGVDTGTTFQEYTPFPDTLIKLIKDYTFGASGSYTLTKHGEAVQFRFDHFCLDGMNNIRSIRLAEPLTIRPKEEFIFLR
jgi:hypothetical protein